MSAFHADPNWFALRVRPNREHTAEDGLLKRGLEAYLPKHRVRRRWSDRVKETEAVLFPGYVFCRFTYRDRLHVLNSPGVHSIVALGKEPTPVHESEISAVRSLVASGRPILPWPYVRIGEQVVVRDGPLAALRGIVVRVKDAWRVVVSVEALGCSVAVEVDADQVAPVRMAGSHAGARAAVA